ncbi:Alpha/Beta hydrolase protein [Exophiala viscosa]|uniref:Alpha/Beta hydrolase protein n=1 Tax=Exophiala viscosa TaxID=2486360 RepID=A0AAN6E7C1_9EURO|nr:Alpha/Beta hydrolase protein [Exophiala viscosa]
MGRNPVETDTPEYSYSDTKIVTSTKLNTSTNTLHIDPASTTSNDEQQQHNARVTTAETVLMKFLRPGRMIPTPSQRKVLDTAETFTTDIDSVPIKTYIWSCRNAVTVAPTVLLSHGFLYNAASMLKFVAPLLRAGYRVVTWDHCAHGESGGDFTDLRLWIRTIQVMADEYAPLAGVVAFSVGSTAALTALAQAQSSNQNLCVPSLVCINPPLQMDTVLKGFLRMYGYDKAAVADMMPLIHGVAKDKDVYLPERARELLPAHLGSGGLANTRVLLVQDRNDSVASVGEAEWVVELLRRGRGSKSANVELRFTEKLDHGGALGDEGVVRLATEFVMGKDSGVLGRASRL